MKAETKPTCVWIFTESQEGETEQVLCERAFLTLAKARDFLRVKYFERCRKIGIDPEKRTAWNAKKNAFVSYENKDEFANYRFESGEYPKVRSPYHTFGEIRPVKLIT